MVDGKPSTPAAVEISTAPAHDLHARVGRTGPAGQTDAAASSAGRWCVFVSTLEQTLRRALRSLERRGLVTLGRYVFRPSADSRDWTGPSIVWRYRDPDDHVPGDSRMMTGALLTEAGWAVVRQEEARIAARRAERAAQAAAAEAPSEAQDALDEATSAAQRSARALADAP
jgi:hypothetical protein